MTTTGVLLSTNLLGSRYAALTAAAKPSSQPLTATTVVDLYDDTI